MSGELERRLFPSQFTYPRNVLDDVAMCFASMRGAGGDLATLDALIGVINDELSEWDPTWDAERFARRAHRWVGRHPEEWHEQGDDGDG